MFHGNCLHIGLCVFGYNSKSLATLSGKSKYVIAICDTWTVFETSTLPEG